ncbi:hypothetical protein MASR2M48_33320 [Spirochaetota bacterium]|jgi:Asp-tRNA(Asn)/Glu-tRNA(Gln) amidotransferase C subunit
MVREELQATAGLAHLDLSEDEAAAALPSFELMLEYFAAMKAADDDVESFGVSIQDLPPTALAVSAAKRFRSDDRANNNNNNNPNSNPLSNLADELLARAPEGENRFIVIPNVL